VCRSIEVTGVDSVKYYESGTYDISNITAYDKPTYKLRDKDRYIYFNPNDFRGWRIGDSIDLLPGEKEGNYFFKSKYKL